VLFDVNRTVKFGPLLRPSAYVALDRLTPAGPQPFRFTAIVNSGEDSADTIERTIAPGASAPTERPTGLKYPSEIFSLSHLAIPIPPHDPLYGTHPDPATRSDYGLNLGTLGARGERGALVVDQDFLTRLPSNPFFPYLIARIDEGIDRPSGASGLGIATTPPQGLDVRLEALLSTFRPSDADSQPFAGP
jgi:hypothetical protein